MITAFSNYIKNIAVCIIFSAFVEMLLPNNSFKKYVDIVLGFIIIIVALSPFKDFIFEEGKSFEFEVFSKTSQIENYSLVNNKDIYESNQKDLIITNYKQQIEKQINELILKKLNLNVKDINIEVDENFESDNFATIEKIELYIDENTTNIENENIIIKQVEKISIEKDTTDVYSENRNRNYDLEKNLESLISDFYKLNEDNIYIIVYKK